MIALTVAAVAGMIFPLPGPTTLMDPTPCACTLQLNPVAHIDTTQIIDMRYPTPEHTPLIKIIFGKDVQS